MPTQRRRRGPGYSTVGCDCASYQQDVEGRLFHPFWITPFPFCCNWCEYRYLPPELLHPFATFIAKSKLLVLPVYPAAWPQAKEHPIVQRFFQFCRYCMSLDVVQKTRYRYQQAERGADLVADSVRRVAARIGLADWLTGMRAPLTDMLTL